MSNKNKRPQIVLDVEQDILTSLSGLRDTEGTIDAHGTCIYHLLDKILELEFRIKAMEQQP